MENIFKEDINSKSGGHMQLITGKKLCDLVNEGKLIQNAKINNCEGVKYDLRISNMLLSGEHSEGIDISKLEYAEKKKLFVAPGEFVFLLTEEIICLPKNIMAMLTSKRKMNHSGVLVLGGSVVDPLYNGRLLFGLYNFSSDPFPIKPDRKITSIMFYQLDDNEVDEFPEPDARINEFPDELLSNMAKYKPTSQQQMETRLEELKNKIDALQKAFDKNGQWFEEFKLGLKQQSTNISNNASQINKLFHLIEKESEKTSTKLEKYGYNALYVKIILTIAGIACIGAAIKYILN